MAGGYKTIPVQSATISGTISVSGLSGGGRMTLVTLNDITWTALPAVPLSNRNGLSVQNQTAIEIKLGYNSLEPGYVGTKVAQDGERFYDITDSIVIYGKSISGTPTVLVEEIS